MRRDSLLCIANAAASRGPVRGLRAAPGLLALVAAGTLSVAAPAAARYSGPATAVFTVGNPAGGLPDQQTQHTNLRAPLTTSLVTVANLGGEGHRSFLVGLQLVEGGWFSFNVREGGADVTFPLAQPVRIRAVSVRCDSFGPTRCRYQLGLVGTE